MTINEKKTNVVIGEHCNMNSLLFLHRNMQRQRTDVEFCWPVNRSHMCWEHRTARWWRSEIKNDDGVAWQYTSWMRAICTLLGHRLLPQPRRLCFYLRMFFCLSACQQNNWKISGRIMMTFLESCGVRDCDIWLDFGGDPVGLTIRNQ